jgi:predicted RNA binding protein YcfA (HicA-like mRNA interferase family)
MRHNPKSIRFEELRKFCESIGFEVREGKGSHYVFTYPSAYPISIPYGSEQVLPIYVKKVLRLLDERSLIDEASDNNDDNNQDTEIGY